MHFTLFTSFIMGVSIIGRLINARWWLIYDHKWRVLGVCLGFLISYGLVIAGYIVSRINIEGYFN